MKEKYKDKFRTKHKHNKEEKQERRRKHSSSSSSTDSEVWVEKKTTDKNNEREDWMSMTGMLKTYSKEDIKPKQEKDKKHIDSYNPSTSGRELNPYWKDGGSGLPKTSAELRKSRNFLKPTDGDYYPKSTPSTKQFDKDHHDRSEYNCRNAERSSKPDYSANRSYNWKTDKTSHWKRGSECAPKTQSNRHEENTIRHQSPKIESEKNIKENTSFLSNEKMNKLAAKIVKAEIMGDVQLVEKLKSKLEAAREYRKQNPNGGAEETDKVMLTYTNKAGHSRPLTQEVENPGSKTSKRKAETHTLGQRNKYFSNDDKYDLAQMFEHEKYGTNYDDEEQLAKVAAKHKNPNDDLEDIFVDEISKRPNPAKEKERERQRAIKQNISMEKSLDGCEYCIGSKNMIKHLMASCGNKVYLALPARRSMVSGQCIITTIQHATCVTSLDEDVWEEIMDYRKALTKFFNSQNKDVVFFESAIKLHKFPHLVINCIPLPRDVGDMAAIYFKKAILECEAEWSMNKKVIDLKGKSIRKCVPKGLPYFWIDFGMDPGFAHVIEDQQLFPKNFAEEIIGGILDLDHQLWKNPKREYGDVQLKKVTEFIKEWKHFDITNKSQDTK